MRVRGKMGRRALDPGSNERGEKVGDHERSKKRSWRKVWLIDGKEGTAHTARAEPLTPKILSAERDSGQVEDQEARGRGTCARG